MNLDELLEMSDMQLKDEYAKARRQSNIEYLLLINTVRIRNIIFAGLEIFNDKNVNMQILYYEHEGNTYFFPKSNFNTISLNGYVNWLIMGHISSQGPLPFDLALLQKLVTGKRVEFINQGDIELSTDKENILNYNYFTEDVREIKLPDVWIPNGIEELEVAVDDMPKDDEEAILLTDVSSYLVIDNYMSTNKTFTDAFYSPKQTKAIILNWVAGIDVSQLEDILISHGVKYIKKQGVVNDEVNVNQEDKEMIDIDLSTIWTAKYKEIIEDAIQDSKDNEVFEPGLTKIYRVPSKIVTTIQYNGENIGLNVN